MYLLSRFNVALIQKVLRFGGDALVIISILFLSKHVLRHTLKTLSYFQQRELESFDNNTTYFNQQITAASYFSFHFFFFYFNLQAFVFFPSSSQGSHLIYALRASFKKERKLN